MLSILVCPPCVFFGWEEYEYRSILKNTILLKLNLIISRWTIDICHLAWYITWNIQIFPCFFQVFFWNGTNPEFCYYLVFYIPTHAAVFRSLVDGYTLPFKLKLRGCSVRNFGSFWDCTLATIFQDGFFERTGGVWIYGLYHNGWFISICFSFFPGCVEIFHGFRGWWSIWVCLNNFKHQVRHRWKYLKLLTSQQF